MNPAVNDLDDDLDQRTRRQREFHLSTGTVLGLFFTLALICALFFGFGYTAGRHSIQSGPTEENAASPGFSSFKPTPGAPAIQPVPGYLSSKEAAQANANATKQLYAPASTAAAPASSDPTYTAAVTKPVTVSATPAAQPAARQTVIEEAPAARQPVPAPVTAAPQPVERSSAPGGPFMVQVAAVSHQEDADVLLSALRRKGYSVAAHSTPTDRLIHVQLGPFTDRHEADTMRQKLLSDGYNAIVK